MGRDTAVGIATRCEPDAPASNSGGGEIFRTHRGRPWGPPNLLYDWYRISFTGVKRPERGNDHPHHLAPRLRKEYSYTSPSPLLGLHCLFWRDIYLLPFLHNPVILILHLKIYSCISSQNCRLGVYSYVGL